MRLNVIVSQNPSHTLRGITAFGYLLLLVVMGASVPQTSQAQPRQQELGKGQPEISAPSEIPAITGAIQLDGDLSDPGWRDVTPLPMTMYQPTFQGDMTERTDIRVAHDADYLYIGASLYDSEPDGILSGSLSRDGGSFVDDYLNIVIDAFNDNENALWFWTTPAGIRGDASLGDDASGFAAMNDSWNAFWDVETRTTQDGWFAEVRIPFSSLGFQVKDDRVVMGFAISRVIARKNERHVFPAIPPNWDMGFAKPSMAQDLVLRGVKTRRPLYVTPYVTSGLESAYRPNGSDGFAAEHDFARDIGGDLRYSLTNNLVMDLSVNTDFAQAEADDQQINLSRFSLFFPEKRQFFQERSSIFDYSLGNQSRLFHSRQIGLANGSPVPILGGARVVGRVEDWDVGLLSMQSSQFGGFESENFTVGRLRRQVFNANSYAGAMVTSRRTADGGQNTVLGTDGIFKVGTDQYLIVKAASVSDSEISDSFLEKSLLSVQWTRRSNLGFNYTANVTRWGQSFVPKLGFFQLLGFTRTQSRVGWGWLGSEKSPIRLTNLNFWGDFHWNNEDGTIEEGSFGTFNRMEFKSGASLIFSGGGNIENLPAVLPLPDEASVPAGRYTYYDMRLSGESAQGRAVRLTGQVQAGGFFDGNALQTEVSASWNRSKHFQIGAFYLFNRVRFGARDGFDAHLVRVRASIALDRKLSVSTFAQVNSASDKVDLNVRLRYNFRERTDLWLVYSEGLNTIRTLDGPRLPLSTGRLLLLKYTYTFAL